jgi:hypothetical protein
LLQPPIFGNKQRAYFYADVQDVPECDFHNLGWMVIDVWEKNKKTNSFDTVPFLISVFWIAHSDLSYFVYPPASEGTPADWAKRSNVDLNNPKNRIPKKCVLQDLHRPQRGWRERKVDSVYCMRKYIQLHLCAVNAKMSPYNIAATSFHNAMERLTTRADFSDSQNDAPSGLDFGNTGEADTTLEELEDEVTEETRSRENSVSTIIINIRPSLLSG